jgi:hypothetical protein
MRSRALLTTVRKLESDLMLPVSNYLREIGCEPVVPELKFFDRGIDVYGIKGSGRHRITFAVELKLTKWSRALQQAATYQLCCDYSYVAMPLRATLTLDLAVFKAAGIGVLCVRSDGTVGEMLRASRSPETRRHYVRAMTRTIQGGNYCGV